MNHVIGAETSVTTLEVVAGADAMDVENGTAGNHVEGPANLVGKSGSAHWVWQKHHRIIIYSIHIPVPARFTSALVINRYFSAKI